MKDDSMPNAIYVITYPRCGSNFLCLKLINDLGVSFETNLTKTHDLINHDGYGVSIIRNPYESIVSYVAMSKKFIGNNSDNEIIEEAIVKYEEFYNYLINSFKGVVFSYDALINVPDIIINKISKDLSIAKIDRNENIIFEMIKDNVYSLKVADRRVAAVNNFVPSSTILEEYEQVKVKLREYDLSNGFDLYNKAKSLIYI